MEKISSMYDIFLNNSLNTEQQYGGDLSDIDITKPHGGFPPIYLCQSAYALPKLQEDKSAISIRTLLERRRKQD